MRLSCACSICNNQNIAYEILEYAEAIHKNEEDDEDGDDFFLYWPFLNVSKVPIITANEDVNAPQAKKQKHSRALVG